MATLPDAIGRRGAYGFACYRRRGRSPRERGGAASISPANEVVAGDVEREMRSRTPRR